MKVQILALLLLLVACGKPSQVNESLIGKDLLLGFHFGQSKQEVLDYCKSQNSIRRFFMSGSNLKVRTMEKIEGIDSVRIDFWPEFDSTSSIVALPLRISRPDWSPWIPEAQAEKLVPSVLNWLGSHFNCKEWQEGILPSGASESIARCGNLKLSVSRSTPAYLDVRIEDISRSRFIPGQLLSTK